MNPQKIEQAWAREDYEELVKYSKKLRDPELKKLPVHCLSFLGVGSVLAKKLKVALRPLWFAHLAAPNDVNCNLNLGNCLKDLEDYRGALDVYLKNELAADDPLINLGAGICLLELGKPQEAVRYLQRAKHLDESNKVAVLNYGRALYRLEQIEAAAESYKQALTIDPRYAPAAINLSICSIRSYQFEQGVSLGEQVFDSGYKDDDYLRTLMTGSLSSGAARIALHFFEKYRQGASPKTVFVAAEAYRYLKQHHKTEELCKEVIKKDKDNFSAHIIMGLSIAELGRASDAEKIFQAGFSRCNLREAPAHLIPNPWTIFPVSDSASTQKLVAERYASAAVDTLPRDIMSLRVSGSDPLKIGYLSPDFRAHPVAECMLPVIRAHKELGTDVHVFSLCDPSSEDRLTTEVEEASSSFHRCTTLEYKDFKNLVRETEVDLLVDLAVYTSTGRPNYLALGLAPIQINHLGYSGTSGARAYDFIVGDKFIIPEKYEKYYSEKVIRLDVPIISSGLRDTSSIAPHSRKDHGLPEGPVIFGCLATPYKFGTRLLRVWAEIMKKVPESIFLVGALSDSAFAGVVGEFRKLGISEDRLFRSEFQLTREAHFGRLKLVDVFLDTYPYNAHSLAADAISANVPVVTLSGSPFASRVAGSLNDHFGLNDLVASTDKHYLAAAVRIAQEAALRSDCKAALASHTVGQDWGFKYASDLQEKLGKIMRIGS